MQLSEMIIEEKQEKGKGNVEREKRDLYHQGESASSTSSTPLSLLYTTKQSFGKASMRVKRSLPKSPRKKKAVMLEMAIQFGLDVREDSYSHEFSIRNQNSIDEDVKERSKVFYFRPDNVYTMPGMKDRMVVWTVDGKAKKILFDHVPTRSLQAILQ